MSEQGRLQKSLKNARVSVFFIILTFLINFLSRKFFLDGLGPELMGMRTTLYTVLAMLSLSELGIGLAVNTSLHKPLVDKDYKTISEIISLQGWLYQWVFAFITLGIMGLTFYLPHLFSDMKSPMIYAYLTLGVSYLGTMLSYTVNYKSVLLNVDQKGYMTSSILSTATIVKNLIQLAILRWVPDPYIYWIAMDLLIALLGVYIIERVTRREYPWLEIKKSHGREYFRKYPEIIHMTGQLFIHQFVPFILVNTTPWLVFKFAGLTSVTFYDNYKNLIANIRALYTATFTNDGPGVANLIAEGDKDRIYNFFWEMYALKQFLTSILAFGMFIFATPFIATWLGEEYKATTLTLTLFCLISHLDLNKASVDPYITGFKLFGDIGSPIVEGGLMIGLSIILGKAYGIDGLLLASYLSQAGIHLFWRPYYLFTRGFNRSVLSYASGAVKFPLITLSLIVLGTWAVEALELDLVGYFNIFKHAAWVVPSYAVVVFVVYYSLSEGFRKVSIRLYLFAKSTLLGIFSRA